MTAVPEPRQEGPDGFPLGRTRQRIREETHRTTGSLQPGERVVTVGNRDLEEGEDLAIEGEEDDEPENAEADDAERGESDDTAAGAALDAE